MMRSSTSAKLEFFNKETGIIESDWLQTEYFVLGGFVYRDNGSGCESQSAYVSFWDFVQECPDIDWRVV